MNVLRKYFTIAFLSIAIFLPYATATAESCEANEWSEASAYIRGDIVSLDNQEWRAKKSSTGVEPGTSKSIWTDLGTCTTGPDEPIPELSLVAEKPEAHNDVAVRAVGFVVDGTGKEQIVSGGEDAYLRSWTLNTEEEKLVPAPAGAQALDHIIYDLEPSVDGSIVVTGEGGWNGGTDSDTLRILRADDLQIAGTRAPIGYVYCVAISPDNQWTVASGFYGDIVVYETYYLEEPLATKATKKKRTKALEFSPDGSILASTSTAGRIQLWSFPQEQCRPGSCELDLLPASLSHSGSWVFPIAFFPDPGSALADSHKVKIVSGTDGGKIKVWTVENLNSKPTVSLPVPSVDSGAVYSLDWSPDGTMIVVGGNGDITVYDAETLEILFQNENAHASRVNDVAFSPDNSRIVSGGDEGTLKLWEVPPAQ